jgi:hypothetical protein
MAQVRLPGTIAPLSPRGGTPPARHPGYRFAPTSATPRGTRRLLFDRSLRKSPEDLDANTLEI